MPVLPQPIAIYFSLPADAAVDDLARAFANNAVARDERQEHRGIEAIRGWRIDMMERTPFTTCPLAVEEREDAIIVPTEVTGSFPGSPLVLEHRFTLRDGLILSLEIA
jgi:hypothetical protein